MRVAGYGDNIVDRFTDRRRYYPGGNCVNFAVLAAQRGVDSAYVGVFGSDEYGAAFRELLPRLGVDISHSVTRDGPSGMTDLTVVDGERVFSGWNSGGVTVEQPLRVTAELLEYFAGFDAIHSSVYSNLESELPALRQTDGVVSYDFSNEPEYRTADYLARIAPFVDLALFSGGDGPEDAIRAVMADAVDAGARAALATRGTLGAIYFDGTEYHSGSAIAVEEVHMVDTMGCGDAFVTAFVVESHSRGWSRTVPLDGAAARAALAAGAAYAARQCMVDGAFGHSRPYATP